VPFVDWCDENEDDVGHHQLTILMSDAAKLTIGRDAAARVVPTHYASEERIAGLLDRLGKPASAKFIRDKLPEGKKSDPAILGKSLPPNTSAKRRFTRSQSSGSDGKTTERCQCAAMT